MLGPGVVAAPGGLCQFWHLLKASALAAPPLHCAGPPERVVHACADARARQRARRARQVLAAMEAVRQAERIGLELFEQGVTEQDVHIIYGEMHVLRELQQKRGAPLGARARVHPPLSGTGVRMSAQ